MALSYSILQKMTLGNARAHLVTITVGVAGDYSSGITPTAAGVGLTGTLQACLPLGGSVAVSWEWDAANSKIRAYKTGAATSGLLLEAAGADVAAGTVTVLAIGDAVNKG